MPKVPAVDELAGVIEEGMDKERSELRDRSREAFTVSRGRTHIFDEILQTESEDRSAAHTPNESVPLSSTL